jgi:hypothetical protein
MEESERARLESLCDYYELQWMRARHGAATANKAIRRLRATVDRLRSELDDVRDDVTLGGISKSRLIHENQELKKKVERLSLKILDLWSQE